jgi:AcrR family transcriptional regulator
MLAMAYMNMQAAQQPRPYRMRARAAAAAETGRRILRSAIDLHTERFHDQITLEDVAERAGVTVQTVLRRFGSREELMSAAADYAMTQILEQRAEAPAGNVTGSVDNLLDHYEAWGASVLRLLAQEDRVPQLRAMTDQGREAHYAWVERTFAPFLDGRSDGRLLQAKLIALTDVYVWKVHHLDLRLDRAETAAALDELIRAVLGEERGT